MIYNVKHVLQLTGPFSYGSVRLDAEHVVRTVTGGTVSLHILLRKGKNVGGPSAYIFCHTKAKTWAILSYKAKNVGRPFAYVHILLYKGKRVLRYKFGQIKPYWL